jgi:hypothetical protein
MTLRQLFIALLFGAPAVAQPWMEALQRPILADPERRAMMFSYVDRQLRPLAIPGTAENWNVRKGELRASILQLVGLRDLDRREPVRWSNRGRIERDSYTIEKIVFESYPGMMVPALVLLCYKRNNLM